ncbi:MAG TPA: Asp-tRNA(Asn)/Glu-tRNA(Gln) amidotransferase subunit GatB, partial [Terriglobales bacterium]|nr:Asp-tRNA(Asn)/Glu-tRNA(Gln) amidotransferase subunit GatB [Terriglobales bacterium]
LYDCKNYFRDLLGLFQIVYDCNLNEASAFADLKGEGESEIVEWAKAKFGEDHNFTKLLKTEHVWTEFIRMRNSVEHPGGKSGSLIIQNVRVSPDPNRYIPPTWARTGRPDSNIVKDMDVGVDNMLTLAEDLLALVVLDKTKFKQITIEEIPVELRDSKCPIRLKIGLSPEVYGKIAAAKSKNLIKGSTGDWEVVIGIEVHAQVTSKSKLFSGASTEFGGAPNSHVSLVDAAMPGMLPVINEECVRQAVRTGLGLNAKINLKSVFDRKNYFYPDLPQGYQISQYKQPVVGEGEVIVDLDGGESVTVGIERLHLEQDAGKSLHERHPTMSFVDLNRSGVALMEIVSKPDLRSAEQAKAFISKLRSILRYLGTCDGDMEKGNLRADVNVSVRRPGEKLGTRCEIKNVNSIRFIGQAIEHEARRQIDILEEGGAIEQETRLFDPGKGETRSMRTKEEAHDYRYFPDPDLLPLELSTEDVAVLKSKLPELPDEKKARFMRDFALSHYDANVLVVERETAEYYEAVAKGRDAKAAANWVINELFGRLNKEGKDIASSPVTAAQLGAVLDLIADGTISGKIAKDLFEILWSEGGEPRAIVEQRGMKQVTDLGAIEKVVDDIITKNPDKVADARTNPKAIGWFVGQVMKSSGGKASPQAVNELLKKKLGL